MTSSPAPSLSVRDGSIGLPLKVEPPPVIVPAKVQPSAGASTTPTMARPSITVRSTRKTVGSRGKNSWCRPGDRRTRPAVPAPSTRYGVPPPPRRSSGNACEARDDERFRPAVELGDEVDVLGLEPHLRPGAPPGQQRLPASWAIRSRLREHGRADRAAAHRRSRRQPRHSSFRIQVAFFERARKYSAVPATSGATSLQSMTENPSLSPK